MLYKLQTIHSEDPKESITIYVNTNEVAVISFKHTDRAEIYMKNADGSEPFAVTHKEANDLIKYTNGLGHYN